MEIAGSSANGGLSGGFFYSNSNGVDPLTLSDEWQVGGNNLKLTANINAVPEPETYAMMLVGLGLLGIALQRSNRSQS
jgi:hypothetical protein